MDRKDASKRLKYPSAVNKFTLLNFKLSKENNKGVIFSKETPEFQIGTAVAIAVILSYYLLDYLRLNIPEWGHIIMGIAFLLGYGFAFTSLFISFHAGKVIISSQRIAIKPKRKPEKHPDSPIYINEETEIRIYLVRSVKFILLRTWLHIQVTNKNEESNFGMLLKNKKKHQQYFDVLESWYRAGYDLREFDQLGNRIFKLNRGTNYADVQKIKKEYGIEW